MDIIDFYNYFKIIIPDSIKNILKRIIHFNKYTIELHYQRTWAHEFTENKDKVYEYWVKYRYLNKIIEICNLNDKAKILDVGCGISTVLHFTKGEKYGIDPLADRYKMLYNYPADIIIKQGFAEKIPFSNNFFDVVFCTNALDHVEDVNKAINEIYRVLSTEGKFVVAVDIFEEHQTRDPAHPYAFVEEDVMSLFSSQFKPLFKEKAPWIGTERYVKGHRDKLGDEVIMVLEKIT
ncbi:MAG: class I SAM-dependent methyltransferase [Desulfobaccales bacterium]